MADEQMKQAAGLARELGRMMVERNQRVNDATGSDSSGIMTIGPFRPVPGGPVAMVTITVDEGATRYVQRALAVLEGEFQANGHEYESGSGDVVERLALARDDVAEADGLSLRERHQKAGRLAIRLGELLRAAAFEETAKTGQEPDSLVVYDLPAQPGEAPVKAVFAVGQPAADLLTRFLADHGDAGQSED